MPRTILDTGDTFINTINSVLALVRLPWQRKDTNTKQVTIYQLAVRVVGRTRAGSEAQEWLGEAGLSG